MSSDRYDPWRDRADSFTERPVRTTIGGVLRGWIILLVIVLLAGLTGIVLWLFGVWSSDIKGQGDAVKIKNEASNRIRAQEGFETLYRDIQAADRFVVITSETLKSTTGPDSSRLRVELNGQRQYCTQLVSQYNAKARKFTQQDFRAADLPPVIDDSDIKTDCNE